jgi:hypothetical protein
MGVSNETKNVIAWEFLAKIKNKFLFPLVNPIQGHTVYVQSRAKILVVNVISKFG